tara:strand:- start:1419 stop:1655 length:237 start_codon:yes stop_codon:yes gene_type:complete
MHFLPDSDYIDSNGNIVLSNIVDDIDIPLSDSDISVKWLEDMIVSINLKHDQNRINDSDLDNILYKINIKLDEIADSN